jgi:peptide/nickel transport system permease protein
MGLPRALIVWKYVLRSALTSVVTQIGLLSGALLGGSVVVEAIFDWPGLGYYTVNSIIMSDYNAMLGATIWIAAIYIAVNMLVDAAHRLIDPREAR